MGFNKTSEQVAWSLIIAAATVGLCVLAARAVFIEIALTVGAVVGVLEFVKVRRAEHE